MTTAQRTAPPENAGRRGLEVSRPRRPSVARVFFAIVWRDTFVTGKEFGLLLVQIALTPLFMLFIFAKVLGELNYVRPEFGDLLLPGIAALAAFLTALQSVAYPLVMEFGVTKEMEDRLLAPLPVYMVAVEKLLMSMVRGMIASACVFPMGALVLGGAPWRASGVPLLLVVLALGSWAGAAIGITVGTLVPPHRISIMFAVIMAPLMFTGATQYPLVSLDKIGWFQVISALNPLTYVSEGMRAALVPSIPHVDPWLCVLALTGYSLLFTAVGIIAFRHRAQK